MASPLSRITGPYARPSPTAPPDPLQMNDAEMSRLAQELVRDLYPMEDVLRQHNIDPVFFRDHVMQNERFKRFYVEAHAMWNSSGQAKERSSLKSLALYEQWLEEANRLFHDVQQPLSSKIEMMKLLSRVAGLDQPDKQAGVNPGERVVVNINLSAAGTAAPTFTIDKTAAVVDVLPEQVR